MRKKIDYKLPRKVCYVAPKIFNNVINDHPSGPMMIGKHVLPDPRDPGYNLPADVNERHVYGCLVDFTIHKDIRKNNTNTNIGNIANLWQNAPYNWTVHAPSTTLKGKKMYIVIQTNLEPGKFKVIDFTYNPVISIFPDKLTPDEFKDNLKNGTLINHGDTNIL